MGADSVSDLDRLLEGGVTAQQMRWKRPRSMEDWEWQQRAGGAQCRHLCFLFWKWGFLLGIPMVAAVWYWAQDEFPRAAYSLAGLVAAYSVLLPLQVWVIHKVGTRYSIGRRGLWHHRSSSRLLKWRDVAGYDFEDHPDVAGVRILI